MRKLCVCLFYGLCVFTIVFSLFWMALPKLRLPVPDPGSEAPPSSAADLAAQALPELAAQRCTANGNWTCCWKTWESERILPIFYSNFAIVFVDIPI